MEDFTFGAETLFDSDLALERRRVSTYVEGVDYKRDVCIGGVWERIKVTSEAGEKSIGRPMGLYDTLTLPSLDTIMPDDVEDAKDEIARELCIMIILELIQLLFSSKKKVKLYSSSRSKYSCSGMSLYL